MERYSLAPNPAKEEYFNTTRNAKVDKDDLAIILHSGGTTGTPKGIMISNYSFNALAQQSAVNVIEVRPKEKILTLLPIFHGFGLQICIYKPLCFGEKAIIRPTFDAKTFDKLLKKYNDDSRRITYRFRNKGELYHG